MIDLANLQNMEPEKLREVAALLGVNVHHRAGKEKMIQDIAEFMLGKPDQKQGEQKAPEKIVAPENTKEEVLKAIKHITEGKPEFKAEFDDQTWNFSYKGASESGNLHIPMKVIVQKADNVSKGARRPMGFSANDGFDGAVGKGYANTVLMG